MYITNGIPQIVSSREEGEHLQTPIFLMKSNPTGELFVTLGSNALFLWSSRVPLIILYIY